MPDVNTRSASAGEGLLAREIAGDVPAILAATEPQRVRALRPLAANLVTPIGSSSRVGAVSGVVAWL